MSAESDFSIVTATDGSTVVSLTQPVLNARAQALAAASACTEISSRPQLDNAEKALSDLKSLSKTMEAEHRRAKEPFLKITRTLDSLKKEFLAPVETAAAKLSRMIGEHQLAERAKADAARRAAAEEQNRIASAAAEKQRERIAEESARYQATGSGSGTLSADLEKIRSDAAAEAAVVAAQSVADCTLASPGTSVRTTWKFTVVNINELAAARPDLVVISPNKAAINAILKATKGAPIPGLEIRAETSAFVRSAPRSAAEIAVACDY